MKDNLVSPKASGWLLLILIITYIVFIPSLYNSFTTWDDPDLLTQNPLVQSVSWQNIKKIFTTSIEGRYYPLTILSFAIEFKLWGLNPYFYHLTNLILHLINIILVFWVLQYLKLNLRVCLFATLLFGLHPLQVESMAWVSSRKDVLFAGFLLLAILNYIKAKTYLDQSKKYSLLALLCFVVSLFAKPMGVSLPFVLLLIDFYFTDKINRKDVLNKLPYLALAVLVCFIHWWAFDAAYAFPANRIYSFIDRFWFSCLATLFYISQIIFPTILSCFYPLPKTINGHYSFIVYAAPLIVFGLIYLILRNKYLGKARVAFLFFLVMMFPVLHFIKINDSLIYERFVYIPSLGIFILLAVIIDWLLKKDSKKPGLALLIKWIFILYIIYLASLSFVRTQIWKNDEKLWSDNIKTFPSNPVAYNNRGSYFWQKGHMRLAFNDFNKAILLEPNYGLAYFNRGNIYAAYNLYDQAIKDYSNAVKVNPREILAFNNRGNMYAVLGRPDLAIKDYSEALKINPQHMPALLNRAGVYYGENQWQEARKDYKRALTIDPQNDIARKMIIILDKKDNDN